MGELDSTDSARPMEIAGEGSRADSARGEGPLSKLATGRIEVILLGVPLGVSGANEVEGRSGRRAGWGLRSWEGMLMVELKLSLLGDLGSRSSIDSLDTADSAVLGGLGTSCCCVSLFDLLAFGENISFLIVGRFFPEHFVVSCPGP